MRRCGVAYIIIECFVLPDKVDIKILLRLFSAVLAAAEAVGEHVTG